MLEFALRVRRKKMIVELDKYKIVREYLNLIQKASYPTQLALQHLSSGHSQLVKEILSLYKNDIVEQTSLQLRESGTYRESLLRQMHVEISEINNILKIADQVVTKSVAS
jgi:hypothetical protein